MKQRVAVAGGTGTVGRPVVQELAAAGYEPVVLARSAGVDLVTGTGLDQALAGVGTVIDVVNLMGARRAASVAFFTTTTRNLLAAGQRAGVRHHVALSIVGMERVHLGYYEGKRRQEDLVLGGPLPATMLRATQFHEFAGQMLATMPGPVAFMPAMRLQPVAGREVAAALVTLAGQEPAGLAPELAGPQEESLPDLARRLVAAQGGRRRVLSFRLPGALGRAWATGAALPMSPGPRGKQTFQQWLEQLCQPHELR